MEKNYIGTTPATLHVSASNGYFERAEYPVKRSRPRYNDKVIPVTFKLDDWHFGDILFGGLIDMRIVDPATGAMWKIDTQYLNETLGPTGGTTVAQPPL